MKNKSVIVFIALIIFVCLMLVLAPFAEAYGLVNEIDINDEMNIIFYFPKEVQLEDDILGTPWIEFEPEKEPADDYSVDLLARILYLEAGSNWIPDWVLEYCGSVVINRLNHWYYPNTLEGVLSQRSQFSSYGARYSITPTERCYTIARGLLEGGSTIPEDIVYFAAFRQGSYVYEVYYNTGPGDNLYFCGF